MSEAATPPSETVTPKSLLIDWANGQDAWIRHLVSEVVTSRKALTDSQTDIVYQMFLREKALAPGDPVAMPNLSDSASSLDASSGLFLTQLRDLRNVNALVEGQTIDFNPKLTIIFGENACGKTGYVRVLKKAAAVRTSEAVLPDVSQAKASEQAPSARIAFRLGETGLQEVEWRDQAGVVPFNRIDVFDSRATALHVDGDLNYLYTPGELVRFPLVQQGIEGVRSRLERGVADRTQTSNPFLAQFDRQSRIYPLVDSLGAATDIGELKMLSAVADAEKDEVLALKTEIDALRTTNPAAQLKLAEGLKQHLEVLIKAASAVGQFDIPEYSKSLERFQKAERRYEEATRESFAGLQIPGVLREEWGRFVQAGEDYLKTLEVLGKYPANDQKCLYCRQSLSLQAVALLTKYRDYCNNDLRTELDRAGGEIEALRQAFQQSVDFVDVNRRIGEMAENGTNIRAEQVADVRSFASKGEFIRDAIESRRPVEWAGQTAERERVLRCLEGVRVHNKALLEDLAERKDKREGILRERERRLLDLESRLKLGALMPLIEKVVEQAKWVDKARIQQRRFQGLLRSLTETSKVASEQLLNRDFERRFIEECKTLRAPVVTLQFPGRQGQVSRKKAVARGEHRPSDVLSEGEQKVIALADFLAEASLKPPAPVVFDDPINSLDYKRMAEVVDRIVVLSDTRQVIVFTHNIWFTTELLARFEKRANDCSYYEVARDGERIGLVSKGTHPRSDTVANLRSRINSLIQVGEKVSGEGQNALIEKGYELIRNFCEVIVEKDLLQGVTQRYQPNVMMTMLPKINFGGLKGAVEAIYPIYEDSCRYIGSHSQPLETLNVRPTLDLLKADWKKVQAARDAYAKTK
jgi:hypothetical protein